MALQTAINITIHYIHFIMSILIKVVSAQLSRDTEFFSNMDPYCILRLGSQSQRTKTKDEAGKKPVWNQSFRFSNPENNLKVIIMDEDNVADDMIGEGQVDIVRFRGSSVEQQHIVQLYYQGKAAGKVMLRISGGGGQQGNNLNQGGNAWGNNVPNNNGGWGQQSNQWGNNQPQPNSGWGMPQQNNNQWGGNQPQQNNLGNQNPNNPNNGWGNQGNGWNQPPNQIGNQGGNQWGGTNPNQQQANLNQFNPILQGMFQASNQMGQQGNPQGNQWGTPPPSNNQFGNQPPNNQWGGNPQAPKPNNQNPNQGWGNNQNPKPNNEIAYPDLEYKPPINNNTIPNQPSNGQGNNSNMDVPYQLIGGMQGLFGKPSNNNSNNQGGNPYQL